MSFQNLKEVMSTGLVLVLPDFSSLFIAEIYASGYGLQAVLT